MCSLKTGHGTGTLNADGLPFILYQRAVQNSPDLISVIDRNYIYSLVNGAYLNRYGKTEDQIVGHSAAEVLGQQVFDGRVKKELDVCFSGEQVDYQEWFTYPELGRRYMDVHYYPLPNADGAVEHVAAVIKDITATKQAQDALALSEQRYRQVLDSLHDTVVVVDDRVSVIYANKAYCDKTGYTVEETNAMGIIETVHPDDRDRMRESVTSVLSGKSDRGFTCRRINKDGETRLTETNVDPIDWPGTTNAIVAVTRDITDQKQTEEAYRLREEKYRRILDSCHDNILVLSETAEMLFANRAWQESMGYQLDEFTTGENSKIGHPIIYPDDFQKIAECFEAVASGKSLRNVRYRLIQRDGQIRWVEANAAPLHWPGVGRALVNVVRDITERKEAEEALKESEKRYRMLFEAANDIIYTIDLEKGEISDVNIFSEQALGYKREMILNNRDFFDFIHPDDRERVGNQLQKLLLTGERSPNFSFRVRKADNTYLHAEQNVAIIHDDAGKPKTLLCVIRDVTKRNQMEESLRLSEERYRRILDACHDMISVVDENTELVFANRAVYEGTGYSLEDIKAIDGFATIHPEDRGKIAEWFLKILNGQPARGIEYRGIHKSGETRWVESNADLIEWPGVGKAVVNVLRDVTDRKQMEEALKLSEERYHRILDTCHDMISVIDENGELIFSNDALHRNTGYTREDIEAIDWFSTVHEKDRQVVAEWYLKVLNGQPARGIEYRGIRKSGETRWVESNADPIQWPGAKKAVVNVLRDVTERKQWEVALRESEQRFRTLLNSSDDSILLIDTDGTIRVLNETAAMRLGGIVDELIGLNVYDLIPPDVKETRKAHIDEAARTGTSVHFEDKRGSTIFDNFVYPVFDNQGNVGQLAVYAKDITVQRWAKKELRESERKYRSLVEITSDWVWEVDADGIYTYVSPKVKELLGYELEEVLGKTRFAFMPPAEAELMRDFFHDAVKTHKPFVALRNKNLHKNGKAVILETSGVPIFDAERNLVGYRGIDRDVTERELAQQALRFSEERYRNIFHEAPDLFYTLDLQTWIITDANRYALETLEYGPEMIGKIHVADIIHPEDYERSTRRLRDMVIYKNRMPSFPLRILTRTGKVRHIEQNGVIFWDESGNAKTFLGLAHDVTERKKHEESIRRRNERIEALYEIARIGIESLELSSITGPMTEIVSRLTNASKMAIFSYDESEGKFQYLAHWGLSKEEVREAIDLNPDKGIHGYLMRNKRSLMIPNIKEYPLVERREFIERLNPESVIAVPLLVKNKVVGSMFISRILGDPYTVDELDLVTAMSSHIAVAIEHAKLYSEIRNRENHLQSILETSQDAIAVFSDQRVIYFNKPGLSMFGYDSADDLSGADVMVFIAPESHPLIQEVRNRLSKNEKVDEILQVKCRRNNGTIFDAEIRLGIFYDRGKRHVVTVTRDVTERKRMEFQLQQSSKLAAIGELAAGVAHEINNPIATVEVHSGLMRDILDDEREKLDAAFCNSLEGYLGIVEDQMERCQSVTGDLLTFSRTPDKEDTVPIDINGLLEKTVKLLTKLTDKKPRIEMYLDRQLPSYAGNPHRLEQVFVNLLNNALKAIEKGGTISVGTRLDVNRSICIEIGDSGPGIPVGTEARIFDPFFTTRPEGQGTGLGLSISYYIVKQMNGCLDVESSPGRGATFTITLPHIGKGREG